MMSSIPSSGSFHSVPLQNITTEGWLELFLTPAQKRTFSQWKEHIQDKSITHRITNPLMNYLISYLPDHIAPNVVTLTGFACLGQAWYITNTYGTTWPVSCTWFSVINILVFYCTNCMDSIQATRLRQASALGDLFKYTTDCNTTVFLAIITTYCLGGNVVLQWYAVQVSQLILFIKHLSAFHRNAGLRYNVLTGPGEVILAVIILLAIRATLGLDLFLNLYQNTVHRIVSKLDAKFDVEFDSDHVIFDPNDLSVEMMMMFYYTMYILCVVKSLMLEKVHGWTRFGLCACLLMRFLPGMIIRVGTSSSAASSSSSSSFELTVLDVICDGFFMAVLTTDVTLAKMAGREIHPWVVLMSICAVFSHSTILLLVAVYYIAVFADLCSYLNMPLLTVCKNVYCDGVYDLCHIGHKTLFRNALQFGNRLYVGVVGDKDASSYKRPPIMTHDERCAEVEACKSVTKVLPNSPCFGLTEEFINAHQIHVVAYGEEYLERYPNPDDDPYYSYPRKIGIAKPLPRHDGLSTSELIRRIQKSKPADERNDS
mmetsp:Transcript_1892/g.2538  ORF Transcript_1892/g.2538 Transcript_1892/m.2538 type:complete len:541 (-) Transcript_1892:267-1889(-)